MDLNQDIQTLVQQALQEDVQTGDITAQLISEDKQAQATVISREQAVICGCAWFETVFQQLDDTIKIKWEVQDGDQVEPEQILCHIQGNARHLLTGERSALNFLQLLSATATETQRYVQLISHTKAHILDTRKTIPALRTAQKYAVHCGGGQNHRMGLYDAFLIKENHILATGSIAKAVENARQLAPQLPVEVEVESLPELKEALDTGVERILLDNFDIPSLKLAVAMTKGKASLEASGNVNLETITDIAETGVDFISIGALTKNVTAIDLSMRIKTS